MYLQNEFHSVSFSRCWLLAGMQDAARGVGMDAFSPPHADYTAGGHYRAAGALLHGDDYAFTTYSSYMA